MNDEGLKKALEDIKSQQKLLHKLLSTVNEKIESVTQLIEKDTKIETQATLLSEPIPPKPVVTPKIQEVVKPPPVIPLSQQEKVFQPLPPAKPPIVTRPVPEKPEEIKQESFEFHFGQVWLIRIGVLLFLTGLVFLGNYTYQYFKMSLGPFAKAIGLYAISASLVGLGFWLGRKKESLQNFSQVVLGGGLAAVYYTTYASHFVKPLRWIESVTVVAFLLLGWAGVMTWIAERKKSQVLAILGLLLAYYTCVINPISWFTLLSNLILSAAAIWLWARNRWTICSWVALAATYGAFAYWQFWNNGEAVWPLLTHDFVLGGVFLGSYWVLFTTSLFLPDRGEFKEEDKSVFLSVNNLVFYGLAIGSMPKHLQGNLWWLTGIFGAVLLSLSFFSYRSKQQVLVAQAYLVKGLIFLTASLFLKFSGLQLGLLILLWSTILLIAARSFFPIFLRIGAGVTAFLAVMQSFPELLEKSISHVWTGIGMGLLLSFEGWWERRRFSDQYSSFNTPTFYYLILGVFCWILTAMVQFPFPWEITALIITAVAVTVVAPRIKLPELAVIGGIYLLVGQVVWFWQSTEKSTMPWWNTSMVLGATLFLSYWWEHQRWIEIERFFIRVGTWLGALFFTLILFISLEKVWGNKDWLMYGGWLSLAMLLYAWISRQWMVAVCGQFFFFLSVMNFMSGLPGREISGFWALVPLSAALLLSETFRQLNKVKLIDIEGVEWLVWFYRVLAMVMIGFWIRVYVPVVSQPAAYGVVGLSWSLIYLHSQNRLDYGLGRLLMLWGVLLFSLHESRQEGVYALDLLAILSPAMVYHIARYRGVNDTDGTWVKTGWLLLSVFGLWIFVSRWVIEDFDKFFLSIGWSLLGLLLFALGLFFKERWYRLSGLGILAFAVGRIVFIDLWQLGTLSRILSLLVCGTILGVLGFIYNRYAETIKKYL